MRSLPTLQTADQVRNPHIPPVDAVGSVGKPVSGIRRQPGNPTFAARPRSLAGGDTQRLNQLENRATG
jgi:hypothetical protein